MRKGLAVLALGCLAVLPGCGGSQTRAAPPDQSDRRGAALACLTDQKKLDARPVGSDSIQIGAPRTGPRVRFYLTAGEAEADQFEGKEEGSEQIGSALLFTRNGSDDLLRNVEDCLDNL
jgi:hypothetical protein